MSAVRNFKCHKQVFHFFPLVFTNAVALFFVFDVDRVLKERCRRSVFKNRFQKRHFRRMRLKDWVGKSAFLPPDKSWVYWVLCHESFDLVDDLLLLRKLLHLLTHLLQNFLSELLRLATRRLFAALSFRRILFFLCGTFLRIVRSLGPTCSRIAKHRPITCLANSINGCIEIYLLSLRCWL